MRAVSQAFLDAIAVGYDVVYQANVMLQGLPLDAGQNLPITGGHALADRRALIRGSGELTIPGQAWVPVAAASPLAPFGQEVQISAGIAHDTGLGDELVAVLVMRIDDAGAVDTGDVVTTITGLDRSSFVQDAGFDEPWPIAPGTNVKTAISALVSDAIPWAPQELADTTFTTSALVYLEGDDRWARCVELAAGAGMELFFDGGGTLIMRPEPVSTTPPVVTLRDGQGGTLTRISKRWSRVGRANGFIVTGENSSGVAVRGEAYDTTSGSPTFYGPPYGKVVKHVQNNSLASDAAALAQAQAELLAGLGIVQAVELDAVPNFALEPGDVATVASSNMVLNAPTLIDARRLPFDPTGIMACALRSAQVLS